MERLPQQVSEKLINAISVYDIFVINIIFGFDHRKKNI